MLLIESLIKTAANSLAVGGGNNVILRGKDKIKILQYSSKGFFFKINCPLTAKAANITDLGEDE